MGKGHRSRALDAATASLNLRRSAISIASHPALRHDRHMPRGFGIVLLALLGACSAQDSAANLQRDAMIAAIENPPYGPPRRITGKVLYGQETVMIGLCRTERRRCTLPTDAKGREQPCWLVFTAAGAGSLTRVTGRQYQEDGEYWIEAEGRLAEGPGGFGHVNAYGCQVEISRVRVFEEGPPWMWAPPPPA
jgi:hypothetical protein